MQDETFFRYPTSVGSIAIAANELGLSRIHFPKKAKDSDAAWMEGMRQAPSALTNNASTQIMEYLAGKRTEFDLPLAPAGSEFQLKVWNAICEIPYGTTVSCRKLADALGNREGYRAVGAAVNACPLPIIIPVHRVVGSNGVALGSGIWSARNEKLIEFERIRCQKDQ